MSGEPLVSQFTGELEKVVARFCDQGLTVAEALGALDLVHAKIIRQAYEEGESEDFDGK